MNKHKLEKNKVILNHKNLYNSLKHSNNIKIIFKTQIQNNLQQGLKIAKP